MGTESQVPHREEPWEHEAPPEGVHDLHWSRATLQAPRLFHCGSVRAAFRGGFVLVLFIWVLKAESVSLAEIG